MFTKTKWYEELLDGVVATSGLFSGHDQPINQPDFMCVSGSVFEIILEAPDFL